MSRLDGGVIDTVAGKKCKAHKCSSSEMLMKGVVSRKRALHRLFELQSDQVVHIRVSSIHAFGTPGAEQSVG
jgi:hypothetical protein